MKTNDDASEELPQVNLSQARKYLKAISGVNADPFVQMIAIQQKSSASDKGRTIDKAGSLSEVLPWAARMNGRGYGIFAVVNETDGEGREASNVLRVRGVWNDCDSGPPDEYPLEPTFRVWTSEGKSQDLWLVDGKMAFDQHSKVLERLVTDYDGDKGAKGLPRILRVSGFLNWKYRAPFLVRLERLSWERYTAKDLAKAFPPSRALSCVGAYRNAKTKSAAFTSRAARIRWQSSSQGADIHTGRRLRHVLDRNRSAQAWVCSQR